MKEKDAWDVYYCIRHFPGGPGAVVEEFRPNSAHGLVREALAKLTEKFASPDHVGPRFVGDFEEITDPEVRGRLQRDAYEQINYVLEQLRHQ